MFIANMEIMPLWKFSKMSEDKYETKIIHTADRTFKINPKQDGHGIVVSRFRYRYEDPVMPPALIKSQGKHYIIPTWQEVIPGTTLEDINWIKPVKKQKARAWLFTSSSDSNVKYKVTLKEGKFKCNCMGYIRVKDKDKGCKHIQTIKRKVKI